MSEQRIQDCANCGTPLTGEYCSHCGQRERGYDLRLGDLIRESAEDVVEVDGRVWRTFGGLMLRPGSLTADYFAGRRARYLPPVRLYLVVSFAMFLMLSLSPMEITFSGDPSVDVEQVQSERGEGFFVPVERESGETEVLTLEEFLREELEEDDAPAWLEALLERLVENAATVGADSSDFAAQLVQRLPQMMFLLLPLFALLLRAAYLFGPYHYLQHLIFSLHFHTAAFTLFLVLFPIRWILPGDFGGIVMLVLLIYLPIAMARVYQSSVAGAIAKSLVVGLAYYFLVLLAGVLYLLLTLAFL